MIDLRSDTLTIPTLEMKKAIYNAELGDEGRKDSNGRGEDPTLNKLENLSANITGKEDAVFFPSGTMGNLVALMSYCPRGGSVAVENNLHIYRSEKGAFLDRPGGLIPEFFKVNRYGKPKNESIKELLEKKKINLLCIENSINFAGGVCLSKEEIDGICSIAKRYSVPVHLDGARIFNASVYFNIPINKLSSSVDSIMFCLSKGLGAPAGSMLCGKHDFIIKARKIKKLLGGTMRQTGILAAAGIFAIQNEIERLREDHKNAHFLAEKIIGNNKIYIDLETVQTNIIVIDVSPSGKDAETFVKDLEVRGLKTNPISKKHIRMVVYRGITRDDTIKASNIINNYCSML